MLNNLSPLQRETVLRNDIHEIKGLDLAAILCVLDRNWFVITSTYFINSKERGNIRNMQEIRNTWAHIMMPAMTIIRPAGSDGLASL